MSKIPKVVVGFENWRSVPEYDGYYEVSDHGRVRSVGRYVYMSRWVGGKILKPQPRDGGFVVRLSVRGVWRQLRIHHLVLQAFVGPCPEGMECRHLNGNPADNRLENLRWGTHAENMRDRAEHGTTARAERHGRAKLNKDLAAKIRTDLASGKAVSSIAKEHGVDHKTIRSIQTGKTWNEHPRSS